MRTARNQAACALVLMAILGNGLPVSAGDKEDTAALIGTWKHSINADVTFNKDGTYKSFLAKGTWKVSEGKLIQIYDILGKTQVDKSDFTVNGDKFVWVRNGDKQTYRRKK